MGNAWVFRGYMIIKIQPDKQKSISLRQGAKTTLERLNEYSKIPYKHPT